MKKFTFLAFITLFAVSFRAKAQIQQGNILIGSTISNLSLLLNSPNNFSFNLTPEAAWFIQDNVALGGYVNFGVHTATGSATTINYGVGALGRYYTGSDVSVLKHGRFFGEATAGLGGVNVSGTNYGGSANTNGFQFGFGPGFSYFVTPNIGLETLLKFNGVTGFGNQGIQSSLSLAFGFQIYLPGKSAAAKVQGDIK